MSGNSLILPQDILWTVTKRARVDLEPLRSSMTPKSYREQVDGLKELLCGYFGSVAQCANSTHSIKPLGAHRDTGKRFKVRWGIPGRGKNHGLRLAVVVYCDDKRVSIAGAWMRRDDPANAEFDSAFEADTF